MLPFSPQPAGTVTVSVTTTTGNAAISAGSGLSQVAIKNAGAAAAFIKFGADNTVEATTSDFPILPGESNLLTKSEAHTYIAAITGSSTTTLYVTPGAGA